MGLWGLINMMFGLGVVAKDAISDSIDDTKQRAKAEENENPVYYVNGYKCMSTKTGRRAFIEYASGHAILKDLNTNEFIEDLTLRKNKITENEEKYKTLINGCVFYRKCDWDVPGHKCNVWVSDKLPGYYRKIGDYYYKGDLLNRKWNGRNVKEVSLTFNEYYYSDGIKYTIEEATRRENEQRRKEEIAKGNKFYLFRIFHSWDRSYSSFYRDCETDECYYHNRKLDYYTLGKLVEKKVQIKPHHNENGTIYIVQEVPGRKRYNFDGSRWTM